MQVNKQLYVADGIDHIHIHHNGKTELGRKLSESFHRPFKHPLHGTFDHLLGYSTWLRYGRHNCLRTMTPMVCMEWMKGRIAEWDKMYVPNYITALSVSLNNDPELLIELRESELPLLMYHQEYGDLPGVAALPASYYESLRSRLKVTKSPSI